MDVQFKKAQPPIPSEKYRLIRWFETLSKQDVGTVGGKNASLGEMIQKLSHTGIRIPGGFATTAQAYWDFLSTNKLLEPIHNLLEAFKQGKRTLNESSEKIRRLILSAEFSPTLSHEIRSAYQALCQRYNQLDVDVAVRSSATAEDLPEASFAGQQESFLNIKGANEVLVACRQCFASLFTERAMVYREKNGFDHLRVALSVSIQKMVRSDEASSGVMFSIDTETGFPDVVLIDAAWGIGESVVQGKVTPDEYVVFKPLLGQAKVQPIIRKTCGTKESKVIYALDSETPTQTVPTSQAAQKQLCLQDDEIMQLAKWAIIIERHYQTPMDIEWAKDGKSSELFIVQARPETVQSVRRPGQLHLYRLKQKGELLTQGFSIGAGIASGKVCCINHTSEMERFQKGDILVTHMTEPDWVPIFRKAAAIVTDSGGRTSHAAIVSREYGIPAVVGCRNATQLLKEGQEITVSCAEGNEGRVYAGILDFETKEMNLQSLPETRTEIMMSIANPEHAFQWWQLPVKGVGLLRMEFIINNMIQIHPLALTRFDQVLDAQVRQQIEVLTEGYVDKTEYFVSHLAQALAQIAAVFHPYPVLIRTSDFKTNEYASLIGGKQFEFQENNPMLGFRGASRYYSAHYKDGFALECRAIRRVREEMGFQNAMIMIPFCRTPEEADKVLAVLAENGLERGQKGLEFYVMIEIPSNVILADQFARRFDGFSIGSNDLTQLVLGVDRDSEMLGRLFDERHEAIKIIIRDLIQKAQANEVKVGICGQAPSDYPEFAQFLIEAGIDSLSLNPDSVLRTLMLVAELEQRVKT